MREGTEPSDLLTVLVVSGGGFQGLSLVKSLRESARIRIVLADCHEENVGRYFADAFHRVPEIAKGEAFIASLLETCRQEEARLVLPSTNHELLALAQARTRFEEQGVQVAVSEPEFLRLAADKGRLYRELERRGFPVLPLVDIGGPDLSFPLIGKPLASWGSRGIVVLRSGRDLAAYSIPELSRTHVFQPLLDDFEELSADFAVDISGGVPGVGIRRRVRTSGGFAVISETVALPAAEQLMSRFAALAPSLGARGLLNVQMLRQGDRLWISDVNSRYGTSAVHWLGTSFNPVLQLCASLAAPSVPAAHLPGLRARRRTVRFLDELVVERPPTVGPACEGVVFDLDDTLLHQKRWALAKLELMQAELAECLPAREEFLREGRRLLEEGHGARLLDQLAEVFALDASLRDQLIAAYRAATPTECPLFADVWPSLATLRRAGLRLGLLTDNPPASQRQKLAAGGLADAFDAVVFSAEIDACKPHPLGFQRIAEALGLPPQKLAMVGDNPYRDALGAARSGYGAVYLLRRPGTFHNFDIQLVSALPELKDVEFVAGLNEVVRALVEQR